MINVKNPSRSFHLYTTSAYAVSEEKYTVHAVTPEITATSAVVIECLDGKILYSKNTIVKYYINWEYQVLFLLFF